MALGWKIVVLFFLSMIGFCFGGMATDLELCLAWRHRIIDSYTRRRGQFTSRSMIISSWEEVQRAVRWQQRFHSTSTYYCFERGGSPYGNKNISHMENFGRTLADLWPSSPSQRFVSEDGVINARARVLGGGSCLNAGFYTWASPEYVRRAGWNGKLVNESYPWVEKIVAHEPHLMHGQSAVRNALIEVRIRPNNGFTYDHIYGTKVGGSIFDKEGTRHTAADLLEYANPKKLTVLLHATVHRVLFTTRGGSRPIAHGVMFTDVEGSLM